MKWNYFLLMGFILMIVLSGCIQQSPLLPEKSNEQKVPPEDMYSVEASTLEPSIMALQLSDLPPEYSVKERTEILKSEVDPKGINLGWEKGYYARYDKVVDKFDITTIEHIISIYPFENISKVMSLEWETKRPKEYITLEKLSDPNIGDGSRAFRVTNKDIIETRYYVIEFFKKDVHEVVSMGGTSTDYELLKELAKKAERKIK